MRCTVSELGSRAKAPSSPEQRPEKRSSAENCRAFSKRPGERTLRGFDGETTTADIDVAFFRCAFGEAEHDILLKKGYHNNNIKGGK